jgi:hypothetical protein
VQAVRLCFQIRLQKRIKLHVLPPVSTGGEEDAQEDMEGAEARCRAAGGDRVQ